MSIAVLSRRRRQIDRRKRLDSRRGGRIVRLLVRGLERIVLIGRERIIHDLSFVWEYFRGRSHRFDEYFFGEIVPGRPIRAQETPYEGGASDEVAIDQGAAIEHQAPVRKAVD